MKTSEKKQRWQETVKTSLPPRKTLSGLPVEPLYLPEDQEEHTKRSWGCRASTPLRAACTRRCT